MVQLLCIRYHVTKSNFKNAHVKIIPSTYRYIQVCTSTYWYRKQHTSFDHAPSALLRLRVSAEHLAWSFFTVFFIIAVSSTVTVRPPRPVQTYYGMISVFFFFYACTFQYIAVCTSMHCIVMEHFWYEPACSSTY